MTGTVEAAIPTALLTALAAFADSRSPALAVAYPDLAFEPVAGEPYLEATYLPNVTVPFAINGSSQFLGLLQVSVMWPAGIGGLVPASELAGEVLAHFEKGKRFESGGIQVCINRRGWVASYLQEPDRIRLPVTIPYQLFHS